MAAWCNVVLSHLNISLLVCVGVSQLVVLFHAAIDATRFGQLVNDSSRQSDCAARTAQNEFAIQ